MDRRQYLEALRDDLFGRISGAPDTVVAQITGQLRATLAELESLPAAERSTSDDLAAKRANRRATPQKPVPATRKGRKQRAGSG